MSMYQSTSVIAPPRHTYSFPNLKIHDIMLCLKELGISMSEDELSCPEKNKDVVLHMLEQLTEICTGTTREEMNQPAFSGLSVLEYPELHEDSVPQINSFRAVQRLMETCGIRDFTIKDFIDPAAKRLRKHLSGIINFAKFREERLVLFTDLTNQRGGLQDQLKKVKAEHSDMTAKMGVMREQRAEEEAEISKTDKECKEIESDISALNHRQAEIREESSALKADNNQLKDVISSKSLQLEELLAQKKKLQGQIVNSPGRFRKEIGDVEKSLRAEETEVQNNQRKHREVSAWLTTLEEVQAEVDVASEALGEVQSELEKQKTVSLSVEALRQQHANKQGVLAELDENISQMHRHLTRLDDKNSSLKKQASARTKENDQSMHTFGEQLIEAETMRVQMASRSERAENDAHRIEQENEAEALQQEKERAAMQGDYREMEAAVVQHLQKLQAALEANSHSNTPLCV